MEDVLEYEILNRDVPLSLIKVILSRIELSKEFGWGDEDKFGVLSHIEHIPSGRLVGYVGDDSLELVHYEDSSLDKKLENPRSRLFSFFRSCYRDWLKRIDITRGLN